MNTIVATEAKNRFGELLEVIQREPVEISKKGRPVAVMMSMESYREIEARLNVSELEVSFGWLSSLRADLIPEPSSQPLNEADYYTELERKYGA